MEMYLYKLLKNISFMKGCNLQWTAVIRTSSPPFTYISKIRHSILLNFGAKIADFVLLRSLLRVLQLGLLRQQAHFVSLENHASCPLMNHSGLLALTVFSVNTVVRVWPRSDTQCLLNLPIMEGSAVPHR